MNATRQNDFYVHKRTVLSMIVCVLIALPAEAQTITNLFNTGVLAISSGTPVLQAPGLPDPHYTLTGPIGTILPPVVTPGGYPFPAWVANTPSSQWISENRNFSLVNSPFGTYVYETSFTLPANANLNTVLISGAWATDNAGSNIRVNGSPTGLTNVIQFPSFTPFSIAATATGTSNFRHGQNTLQFVVRNSGGPSGLHVTNLRGTFQIPEPASGALVCCGAVIIGACVSRRRRRAVAGVDGENSASTESHCRFARNQRHLVTQLAVGILV